MFDLDELIDTCRSALSEASPAVAVRQLVARAVADPAAVMSALPDAKGVTVLFRDRDLTVLNVVVPGGLPVARSIAHNHRMWAVVGIYAGQEDNRFFRRDGTAVIETTGRSLRASDTLAMGDDTIHAVHNPLDHESLGAIHVYGGDLLGVERSMWAQPDFVEEPYDDAKVVGRGGFRRT